MRLKVLSWNIWIFGNFDQTLRFLKESNADIMSLQEVQDNDPKRDTIKFLTSLGYQHIFLPVQKAWGGRTWNDGPAIFSRYPIIQTASRILSQNEGRGVVRADINIHKDILHIFSTHLKHTHQQQSDEQEEQAANLLKMIPSDKTLVMGDFNATPDSTTIQKVKSILVDTDSSSKPTWSQYTEGCTKCRIGELSIRLDYIFTTGDIKVSEFRIEDSKASDHLPITVILDI